MATECEAVILEDDSGILGCALYREGSQEVVPRQFFVIRHRRRGGVGRQAMETICDKVWPKDTRILVEVLCQNLSAILFWKAVGYKEHSLVLKSLPGTHNEETDIVQGLGKDELQKSHAERPGRARRDGVGLWHGT